MKLPIDQLKQLATAHHDSVIDFTQRLVQIPSRSGHEGDIAPVIRAEMMKLGYDEVWTDDLGSIIGKIKGGDGPTVLLNGHMDHVDPGPATGWPYPPFSGQIVDGELWGRASVDMKGPVAAMIYGASLLKKFDPPLSLVGDVIMMVTVMEEIGCIGAHFLAPKLPAEVAICGEPSRNTLRLGHRGRVEILVTFKGHSAHASVPHLATNPHYDAAHFLLKLQQIQMVEENPLGISTVVPTQYQTDQTSANVSPSEVYLTLDWRNVSRETPAEIVAKVKNVVDMCLAETASPAQATVTIPPTEFTTYTGLYDTLPTITPSFLIDANDPLTQAAQTALTTLFERDSPLDIWQFATEGGRLMAAGIPTLGFGPGNELLAHTNQERLSLTELQEALVAYPTLVLALADEAGN